MDRTSCRVARGLSINGCLRLLPLLPWFEKELDGIEYCFTQICKRIEKNCALDDPGLRLKDEVKDETALNWRQALAFHLASRYRRSSSRLLFCVEPNHHLKAVVLCCRRASASYAQKRHSSSAADRNLCAEERSERRATQHYAPDISLHVADCAYVPFRVDLFHLPPVGKLIITSAGRTLPPTHCGQERRRR